MKYKDPFRTFDQGEVVNLTTLELAQELTYAIKRRRVYIVYLRYILPGQT